MASPVCDLALILRIFQRLMPCVTAELPIGPIPVEHATVFVDFEINHLRKGHCLLGAIGQAPR